MGAIPHPADKRWQFILTPGIDCHKRTDLDHAEDAHFLVENFLNHI